MNVFKLKRLFSYLKYTIIRPHRKGHGIHSPFLFDYVTHVLDDKTNPQELIPVSALRKRLLKEKTVIEIEDFGAGSGKFKKPGRSIKDVARFSSSTVKYGKLLYKTAAYFRPETILELGTCLGIGTAYMAVACPFAKIVTIEGSRVLMEQAKKNFDGLNTENITPIKGNFDQALPQALKQNEKYGLVFIDGNHQREALLSYFFACLPYMTDNGVIIIDDIRWSSGMFEAWQEIIMNVQITLAIDLFQLGIVFLDIKLKKQHFQLYY